MPGRHRHAVNVRADGLATVLAPLLTDTRVRGAALVDVDSGMVLDTGGGSTEPGRPDPEELAAGHAELMRIALGLLPGPGPGSGDSEIVVDDGNGVAHVVRTVADPHGDRLALSVVVEGSPRVVARIRKRLRAVSASALTAGPSMSLRPAADGWTTGPAAPDRFVPRARPVRRPAEVEPEGTGPDETGSAEAGPDGAGAVPARVPAMTVLLARDGPPAGPPTAGSIWLAAPVPSEGTPFGPAVGVTTAGPVPFPTGSTAGSVPHPAAATAGSASLPEAGSGPLPAGATSGSGPLPAGTIAGFPLRAAGATDDRTSMSVVDPRPGPASPVNGSVPLVDRRPTPPTALPPGPRRPAPEDEQTGR